MRTALLLSIVLAGCVTTQPFVFRPTETPNLTPDDAATARYVVPRALPRGEMFVTSEGVIAGTDGAQAGPALHVRATVFNVAGQTPWAMDIREQIVTLPGGVQIHPGSVKTTAAGAPILAIAPGERIAIDLYFPLPDSQQSASVIPAFNFIWQVTTDRKRAAGTVPFGRFAAQTPESAGSATVATAAGPSSD